MPKIEEASTRARTCAVSLVLAKRVTMGNRPRPRAEVSSDSTRCGILDLLAQHLASAADSDHRSALERPRNDRSAKPLVEAIRDRRRCSSIRDNRRDRRRQIAGVLDETHRHARLRAPGGESRRSSRCAAAVRPRCRSDRARCDGGCGDPRAPRSLRRRCAGVRTYGTTPSTGI